MNGRLNENILMECILCFLTLAALVRAHPHAAEGGGRARRVALLARPRSQVGLGIGKFYFTNGLPVN